MDNFRAEVERRIAQFAAHLRPMYHRAHEVAHGPCFIIFEERPPHDDGDPVLVEKKELALAGVRAAFDTLGFFDDPDDAAPADFPGEGWRAGDDDSRFIQFSAERQWFCLDMPRQTLERAEAGDILRYRKGFFYLSDRQEFTLHEEDVDGHEPFRKVYVYGDEDSAAEDMAFIFFQVWKFPVDARFYVTSAAFNGKHAWEKGVPIG